MLVVLSGHGEAKRQSLQPLAEQVPLAGAAGIGLLISLRRMAGTWDNSWEGRKHDPDSTRCWAALRCCAANQAKHAPSDLP